LGRIEQSGARFFEAEVHRCHGDVLLAQGDQNAAEAEASYGRALDIARGQSARLWELRAATGLARLCRDHGKRQEAVALLAQVYGWFTEGFDTPDLQEAKVLLDELR